MPRPRPPSRWPRIPVDHTRLSDAAGLPPDDDDYRRLKAEVRRLVDDYVRKWTPGRGPGRRNETPRNDLIASLAEVFQARSNWSMAAADRSDRRAYLRDYRGHLQTFLLRALIANGIFPPGRLSRLIPKRLRVPRTRS